MFFQTVINGSSMMYRISPHCQAAPAYHCVHLSAGWAAGRMEMPRSSLHWLYLAGRAGSVQR